MTHCQGCGAELPPRKRASGRARKWCSDSCRKSYSYSGTCVDCGAHTAYSGQACASLRCRQCAAKKVGADAKRWTRDAIVAAIREWASIYGEHPRVCDWNPDQAKDLRRALHQAYVNEPNRWPHHHTVMREFGQPGGWARAVRAAGFEPRRRGRPSVTSGSSCKTPGNQSDPATVGAVRGHGNQERGS